ncbi:hypothetical protein Lsan_2602 [Legionella santicrucis]|uniref:Uncharacterized protein n=1 Tax=Legionella santicrucis TaxID=45074 RepID=A0A0W0YJU4_9GAMM|nr:hypothetical protein [Legionella santicrucis]KTD56980.1 hypothetical protein Lsan_2602 [Legionella santicrucis]
MTQSSQEQAEVVPLNKMIFFQNLALGQQQSHFIDHFKSECIAFENNEEIKKQREQLLLQYPPILSFHDEYQEKIFYENEIKNHQQFCCGKITPISIASISDIVFSSKDSYVFSPGNGKFYTGSQKAIVENLKQDISQASFGSSDQNVLMNSLKTFDATVSQRSQSNTSVEIDAPPLPELKSPSPFNMNLKPKE